MSGICIVSGTEDATARAEAVTSLMATHGQKSAVRTLAPAIAIGRAWHGRLPHEHMPETNDDRPVVLLDGEIFNENSTVPEPEELIRDLYTSGRIERCAWLNGSFSAVVYDRRERKVVLVSDRVGSRPLFVYCSGDYISVASRLDALLADPEVSRELSLQGLTELISFQRTVADHTQYRAIMSLPASAVWVFSEGKLKKRQARRLAWSRPTVGKAAMAEQLGEALKAATRRRTSESVRTGLLLSGGLDARLVLAAANQCNRELSCLTVGPEENMEVEIARRTASVAKVPFEFFHNSPLSLSFTFDDATIASHGLFAAPMNLFGLLPAMAGKHDVLLSGHGLDYTLRGYYLPCVMLRMGGSTTRLPRLRSIPDGSPETVADSLRVGIGRASLSKILAPAILRQWDERRYAGMAAALAGADIENPYNAWDAFILHSLGRHYAWSDFAAMNSIIEHRAITFDPDVLDIYFSMPPEWRAHGDVAHRAMIRLGADLMEIPDANTGFPAKFGFAAQITLLYGRALLRRTGLIRRPKPGDPNASLGSWANYGELFRNDPMMVERVRSLASSESLMDTGLFSARGLVDLVEDYLGGRVQEKKLIHQLMTLSSWLDKHSYTGVSA